ncbi:MULTISPECIES: ShlB/FhaC/HecB family hemolysin secretion/activation protein [unclassified Sphingomonas]|uniref:ShlB/FhaC/HecB family hemolysin secretion/activation protein n=1 Tax=unclassified Sphingomonas TaxID=196159 RepID=UPI00226A246B|nr:MULTISPECIES: ShlB/FhaC/HecB family hemolysin secretion/activation protein [unclassified Sphingomonas]
MRKGLKCSAAVIAMAVAMNQAPAQIRSDRTDPALVTRSLPLPSEQNRPAETEVQPQAAPGDAVHVGVASTTPVTAITVTGSNLPPSLFEAVTRPYRGRSLQTADLTALAGAVAGVARAHGLVFASAAILPQPLANGTLTVSLDEGRVDAVRSLGVSSPAADRLLSMLVTHAGVTRAELERTLLLVGDLPGVTVVNARYARENGFGVLLVTIAFAKTTLYAQLDNRGTDEIGPWRATELASIRTLAIAGDELSLIASQTPFQPREFQFFSGQYALPVGKTGDRVSASAFYGATRAGADLGYLDLTGKTYGAAIGYSATLQRTKAASFWLDLDLHTIRNQQNIRGTRFRDDSLTVLSATLRTAAQWGGGAFRGGVTTSFGLPMFGATRAGDPRASRDDGDARFVTESVQADWTRNVAGPLSLQLASAAQIASRPLLATAEMSLGGPLFGRAYDYSERTGDEGIAGSAEARLDLRAITRRFLSQAQAYAFIDGGTVSNLADGPGGGSLASSGGGVRVGMGRLNGAVEVAFPLTSNRFDTGDRTPRVSTRMFVAF